MKIGIIGAENFHVLEIAKIFNKDRYFPKANIIAICGDNKSFSERVAEKTYIPEIVTSPRDMLGMVNRVIIANKDPEKNYNAAIPFIEKGIPVYIENPITLKFTDALKIVKTAQEKNVPFATFSISIDTNSVHKELEKNIPLIGKVHTICTSGPCDISSKFSGLFFYGINQILPLITYFGSAVESITTIKGSRGNPNLASILTFKNGGPIVSMSFLVNTKNEYRYCFTGIENDFHYTLTPNKDAYISAAKKIHAFFKSGVPESSPDEMLTPLYLISLIEKSLRTEKTVKVSKLQL